MLYRFYSEFCSNRYIVSLDKYYAPTTGLLLIIIIGLLLLTAIYELLHAKGDWILQNTSLVFGHFAIMYFCNMNNTACRRRHNEICLIQIAIIRIVFKAVYQKKKRRGYWLLDRLFFLSFGLFILISPFFSPKSSIDEFIFFVFVC